MDLITYALSKKNLNNAVDNIMSIISSLDSLTMTIVDELPDVSEAEFNKMYLIDEDENNMYEQYILIENGQGEREFVNLGTTVDLSGYYTSTQTDTLLSGKQDTLTFDNAPTSGSSNVVTSDGIYKETAGRKYFVNGELAGETFNALSNTASGSSSHAEGRGTTASGAYSHAEGILTTASGQTSHAEGESTIASGYNSHAGGCNTQATHYCMTAIGKYNDPQSDSLFEIGNGTSNNTRSNILAVSSTYLNVNGTIQENGIAIATPYTTMPTITAAMVGQVAQYMGTTTATYTKGCFYVATSDGAASPTYTWKPVADEHIELTQAEYDQLTPAKKAEGIYFITDAEAEGDFSNIESRLQTLEAEIIDHYAVTNLYTMSSAANPATITLVDDIDNYDFIVITTTRTGGDNQTTKYSSDIFVTSTDIDCWNNVYDTVYTVASATSLTLTTDTNSIVYKVDGYTYSTN